MMLPGSSAAMVLAGVVLLACCSPVFELATNALLMVALLGIPKHGGYWGRQEKYTGELAGADRIRED